MEIKIPKEVHQHRETIFFGLSTRQFLCSTLAVGAAVGVYFVFKGVVGQDAASWLCILAAAPIAVTGFFRYNGLTFERFVWAFLKSQVLCAGPRVYRRRISTSRPCRSRERYGEQERNPERRERLKVPSI